MRLRTSSNSAAFLQSIERAVVPAELAGKTAAQNVERRNVRIGHGVDVAVRGLAEVRGVGLPAELVPVAGEDAFPARLLEGETEPADAAEEVHEAERRALLGLGRVLPSDARRSVADAVGSHVFAQCRSAALLSRSTPRSRTRRRVVRRLSLRSGLLRVGRPALLTLPPHASTPLQS